MRPLLVLGTILLFFGCAEKIKLVPGGGNVAVGSKLDILGSDGCTDSNFKLEAGPGKISWIKPNPPTCVNAKVTSILSKAWSDPAVFELTSATVTHGVAHLVNKVLKEGEADLDVTFETDTGTEHEATGHYKALKTNRVELTPPCPTSTHMLQVDTELTLKFRLYHDQLALYGYDYYPFKAAGLTMTSATSAEITYRVPKTPQTVTVTSPADKAFKLTLQFVDAASLDKLELMTYGTKLYAGKHFDLALNATLKGKYVCKDTFERRLTTETPATCAFSADGKQLSASLKSSTGFSLYGLKAGSCKVSGKIVGSQLSDTLELMVHDPVVWSSQTLPSTTLTRKLQGIWGSGPSNVFVVGEEWSATGSGAREPLILRYDGTSWAKNSTGLSEKAGLRAVWGSGSADVYAVGYVQPPSDAGMKSRGLVLRHDGTTWSEVTVGDVWGFQAVWGSSASDVYIAGSKVASADGGSSTTTGALFRYDGTSWSEVSAAPPACNPRSIWGSGPTDVHVLCTEGIPSSGGKNVIARFDGTTWTMTTVADKKLLLALGGTGASDAYAVGSRRAIFRYDGSQWKQVSYNITGTNLAAVWANAADAVWAVGSSGGMVRWDGATWESLSLQSSASLVGIWGSGAKDIFVISADSVFHN